MSEEVLFTVICATYNRSSLILPTIRSVLAQSVTDFELLVLSDGSTDDTVEVVRRVTDPRVRVIEVERTGHPSGPRQEGLRLARGRYVAYIDHDDTWRSHHLQTMRELLEDGAELAVSGYQTVDDDGRTTRRSGWWDMCWHPELQYLDPMFEPTRFAHRRGLLESVGGWRVTTGLEDWDLLVRLTEAGHRPRTTTARTVVIYESTSTRRHQMAPVHWSPLLQLSDARLARRIQRAIEEPAVMRELSEAAQEDSRRRIERLRETPEFVRPRASEEVPYPGELPADNSRGPNLLIVPRQGGYALSVPVFLTSPEHGARFDALVKEHASTQLGVLRRLETELSDHAEPVPAAAREPGHALGAAR